ncbi:MAG TPA: replicative DNA helicase, partial [Polyangia bacterium]|nr:replicative DNA helicase [Polyangia bacterium]
SAIEDLSKRALPVDHVTLGNELSLRGDLEKIGGAAALDGLTDRVATVANVEHYARLVREKAAVRRMIYAAQQVVADGFGDFGDAEDFLDGAEASIFKAAQQRVGSGYTHVAPVVKKAFDELDAARSHKGEVTGLPSGFAALDRLTAGFQRSDLIIVAGRPAMGKTALALNMAFHAAFKIRKPVIVFSLEMSKDQLVRRLFAAVGRVDATRMRSNRLESDDWPRLIQAADLLNRTELFLDDSTPMTPLEIRAKSRRLKAEKGLGLVVVDYLQLMRSGTARRADNREQEISEISRSMKGLAKELDVPVIALSQLNRGVESRPDKRPMMSDLRESGAIEQDADLILFVYRDEVYNKDTEDKDVAEIIVGKQRSGPTGIARLRFTSRFTRFDNLAQDESGQPSGGDY